MRKPTHFELWFVAAATVLLLVILPGLNAFTAPGSVLHVSDFTINLYGKYLCYGIVAISVDLLWGYTGLLSLGQCLFFALGGYMMGMYLAFWPFARGSRGSIFPFSPKPSRTRAACCFFATTC
jgi:urea transport system permease protein